jgi:DNA-binding NarL/FixJ family response regulator
MHTHKKTKSVPSHLDSNQPELPGIDTSPQPLFIPPKERDRRFQVAVVDDEPDVLKSVRFILDEADEFEPSAFYLRGQEALSGILTQPPDVVLMDIRLPDLSGIECTRRLTAGLPQLRVVMISALDDRRTMEDAIRAGCHGYLTKPFGPTQCLANLRCALAARLPGATPPRLPAEQCPLRRKTDSPHCFRISQREVKVLGALTDGKMYKEISADMKLSPGLTHKLINRVFQKLGVHSRHELVQRWLLCSRCANWTVGSGRVPRIQRDCLPPANGGADGSA